MSLIQSYNLIQNKKLKKLEAKKFQELAEAFKQHDIERELLVQKKVLEIKKINFTNIKL